MRRMNDTKKRGIRGTESHHQTGEIKPKRNAGKE